ncbi:MAG TPA: hypothetical protein VFW23_06015 [Tepidisphaeraceae bacterium]|nr:hypothetical protein [Tepidisphaeraceae bacterium]
MDAPKDGSPVWIGYEDARVTSPDGKSTTEWKYKWEPPHGDGLFSVRFQGRLLPELFWGRGYAWSPASDYFTLEQHTTDKRRLLFVVRVSDGRWFKVAEHASVDRFVYPTIDFHIRGKEQDVCSKYRFSNNEVWELPD